MNRELFLAILAMDAYNRGNAPGIAGLSDTAGTQIGKAFVPRAATVEFSGRRHAFARTRKLLRQALNRNSNFVARLPHRARRNVRAPPSVRMLRIASMSLMCGSLVYTDAVACRGADFEETIFFEDVPAKSTEPIVAQVTILQVHEKGPYTADDPYALFYVGIARVERVLRGTLSTGTIKILAPFIDCQRGFGVGASGIVLGTTRIGSDGVLELIAISEMRIERRERQRSENKN